MTASNRVETPYMTHPESSGGSVVVEGRKECDENVVVVTPRSVGGLL